MLNLGGGMIGLAQCPKCEGSGEFIEEIYKCKSCIGKKVINEIKAIEVIIDKGTPHNEKYTFHGEGDETPTMGAGDVIIVCKQKPHDRFTRRGADIFMD